jgi:hypothetical protein
MIRKLLPLFFILPLFLVNSKCEKEIPLYKDSNLVTLTINGKAWKAETQEFSGPPVITGFFAGNLTIVANNTTSGIDTELNLKLRNISPDTGTYILNNQNPHRAQWKDNSMDDSWHYTDSINTGTMRITSWDTVAKKITGTFEFDAKNLSGHPVTIRDGNLTIWYKD